ncbi:unnamed protein product [Lactuca virosa]|uniref:CCHC-type domain-containing protein n=1 Tax=Lactuca virosa TaxID=75947 RepID=A0AAU9P089_9ASTR|nr:unnamed protein product [Lactuca virosa]
MPTLSDTISDAKSYALFQQSIEEPNSAPVAFAAQYNGSHNHQRGGRLSSKNHYVSRQGGGGRNADGGGNNSHSGSDRRNNRRQYTPKCQICKVLGHVAPDCPERLNPTSGSSSQANLTQAFNAVSLNSGETSDCCGKSCQVEERKRNRIDPLECVVVKGNEEES